MAPLPRDLQDRRVEITGPTDAKMVINALNSGASLYMADFEDSNCPTWANTLEVGCQALSTMPCTWAPYLTNFCGLPCAPSMQQT